jgi:hypothetical protein
MTNDLSAEEVRALLKLNLHTTCGKRWRRNIQTWRTICDRSSKGSGD